MKPKCLCQLCSCGRHRCPRNCTHMTDSCGIRSASEYKTTYIRKDAEPVKSFKPEPTPLMTCDPISDQTTNRVDFIRHPLDQIHRHKSDPYFPPEGPFDGCTVYKTEYIRKAINPSKAIHKNVHRMCPPPFEGQTSNKTDYIRWPRVFEKAKVKQEYYPNSDPFDDNTIYRTNFIRHESAIRPSMKPNVSALVSQEPLDTRTEHRDQFIRHDLPEKTVRDKQEYHPLMCPIEDQTVYKSEFGRKEIEFVPSYKPDVKPTVALEPLDDKTTNRVDYIRWPLSEPYKHRAEPYVPIEGQMTSETTHRVEYTRKPLEAVKVLPKRDKLKCISSPFDANTTYRCEYLRWDSERPHKRLQPPYVPLKDPFCDCTSYRNDYIRMGRAVRKSKKPETAAIMSTEGLQDCTEYRNEFTRKAQEPCVAGLIASGVDTNHKFVQQDAACHKWYQPMECNV